MREITKLIKDYDNINYCYNYNLEPDCEQLIRFVNQCSIKTHRTINDKLFNYIYNFHENPLLSDKVMMEIDNMFSKTLEMI